MPVQKEYIGDSVYADIDENEMIRLTTEDGRSATNTIYLEPEVAVKLIRFLVRATMSLDETKLVIEHALTYDREARTRAQRYEESEGKQC